MDSVKLGKRIAELRKAHGLTQKELAAALHVTDGAVSKWERGINFPDLAMLEPLADALDINVIALLGLENATKHEVASTMTDISVNEKAILLKELKRSAVFDIVIGFILIACLVTASLIFKKHNIYGMAHGVTIGAIGFVGTLIGSEVYLLRNINKV